MKVYYKEPSRAIEESILGLQESLVLRIDDVLRIIELNKNIIDIANDSLGLITDELKQAGKGGGIIAQIANKSTVLSKLSDNEEIKKQILIVREQVAVLFITSLEVYSSDVIRLVGNERSDLFNFKNSNEKITFDQRMLKDGFRLGDAILEHILAKGNSFQDLQSSLRIFSEYLDIKIVLTEENREALILIAASRNIIIHNSSKVNRKFLDQIERTKYKHKFVLDETVSIDDDIIVLAKDAIEEYASQITGALIDRI